MPINERGALGPGFERRLKLALDSVVPSAPLFARYFSTTTAQSSRPLRFASALVGIGAVGIMAVSAMAATGSPNPAVWTQRAASTIQSVSHIPETSPNPAPSPNPEGRVAAPVNQQTERSHATPPPSQQAEPSDKPHRTERPQESPAPDGSARSDPPGDPPDSPEPSDSPGGQKGQDPTSPPPPHDRGGDSHGISLQSGTLGPSDFAGARRF